MMRRIRARFVLTAAVAAFLAAQIHVPAQEEPSVAGVLNAVADDPQPRVRAEDLARVLGASLSAGGEVLVLRRDGRAATFFADSSEVVVAGARAAEESLSAPAAAGPDGWWLPLDAGAPLGLLRVDEGQVRGPDGRVWRLNVAAPPARPTSARAEVVHAAPGVRGLHLFAPGPGGDEDVLALWVSDLSLAPLVVPQARAALDAALAEAGSVRALLLIGTSLVPGVAMPGPSVHAESRRLLAPGERLDTLSGDAASVGPDAPWVAVAWLPPGVRLDRPLRVVWHGAEAEIVLRD